MLIRNFMKDVKNYGFKYAAVIRLMNLDEIFPCKWIDTIAGKCYDYAYTIDFPYPEDERN